MSLLEWQNLIFILPMLAGILYLLLMTMGSFFGGDGDMDAGHDVHLDVSHDVHLDVGHGVSLEAGHDVSEGVGDQPEVGHDGHDQSASFFGSVFSLLGVGKVPLSILLISLCFIWGGTGLVLNLLLGTESMVRVILFAALAAVVGARLAAECLAMLLPREESYHTLKAELIGLVGEVLYEVTRTSGTVRLRDPSGNLLDLDCRIQDGPNIKAGSQVKLQEYDGTADIFFVTR